MTANGARVGGLHWHAFENYGTWWVMGQDMERMVLVARLQLDTTDIADGTGAYPSHEVLARDIAARLNGGSDTEEPPNA